MPCFLNVELLNLFLISSSDLIAWQLLLEITHCVRLSPQSVSSRLISSHVFWAFFTSSHLIASHVFSPFLISSQLITAALLSSHVTWAFLMIFAEFSQLFSTLLSSPPLMSAHLMSPHLFSPLLTPQLISALVSSSHIILALLSALSYHLSSSLPRNLLQKRISHQSKQPLPFHNEAFVRDFHQKLTVEEVKTELSWETPSKTESWRCENEAFVRDFHQKLTVEEVKTELSWETPLKIWKRKMWKRSFRARPKSESWRCENEAFVRGVPQNLKIEDVKTELSWETSSKNRKLKTQKRSPRARLPSKTDSWRCEDEAFVRTSFQELKVEDMKTKLSWETSLKMICLCCETLLLQDLFAMRSLCIAVRYLCCEISLLRDLFAVRSLCYEIPLLWDLFAISLL